MTLKVLASDAQGALSEGDNSNTAFAGAARVGQVAYVDIAPPEGYKHAAYVIPGVAHVALSLSAATGYGAEGADLTVGAFSTTRRIYIKVTSASDPAPKLVLPSAGFTEVTSAQGVAGSTSGVSGALVGVQPALGVAGSASGASGAVVSVQVVGGSAGSTSGVTGDVTVFSEIKTAEGFAGSTSGVTGSVIEVEVVAGVAGSTSGAVGDVTEAADPYVFLDTFDGNALVTGRYMTAVGGTGASITVGSGQANITDSTTAGSYASMAYAVPVSLTAAKTFRVRARNAQTANEVPLCLWKNLSGTTYAPAHDASWYLRRLFFCMHVGGSDSGQSPVPPWGNVRYAGVDYTSSANVPYPCAATQVENMSTTDWYDYIIEIAQNAGVWQIRGLIKNSSGTTITESNWLNTSALASGGTGSIFMVIGHPFDDPADVASRGLTAYEFQVT